MRRSSVLVASLAALSSLAVVTAAGSAHAESSAAGAMQQGCFVSTVAGGTRLPSNAPAVFLDDRSQGATATVSAELISGETRTPLVGPVKDAHGITVLQLAGATAGNHTIAATVACSAGNNDASFQTHIVLEEPVAFPKSVGTLRLRPTPAPATGTEVIVLEPSAELRAFGPISILTLEVGGKISTTARDFFQAGSVGELRAPVGAACVENGALLRERRRIEVSVHAVVAGLGEAPAPATLDVDVDCGAIKWTSATQDLDPVTTETGSGSTEGTPVSAGAGGCSAAGGVTTAGATSGATALLAGILVLARRRRRRSSMA